MLKNKNHLEFISACHNKHYLYQLVDIQKAELIQKLEYCVDGAVYYIEDDMYYTGKSHLTTTELICIKNKQTEVLTKVGECFFNTYKLSSSEPLNVECEDGHVIHGWVIKPHNYIEGKKYPGLLVIHGGPQSAYYDHFYFSMQRYAAAGYFVFYCNPRGSANYGIDYMYLQNKFGTIDYDDIMLFTDEVIKKYPDLDGQKLGVTGGSYGGYMTNWIIGHTNRFKAAIAQRSISNWISLYGCSDLAFFVAWTQDCTSWENSARMWDISPIKYVNNITTPTLFLQNNKDFRCPVEQAEQMFTSLLHLRVPTRMVLLHGASHSSMLPKHKERNDDEIISWLDKYIKSE